MFSYVSLEARVPTGHPLRPFRAMTNRALGALSGEFSAMYSTIGRPSIAPERLLRALLLQILYSIRSERLLMEQLEYNLLFRWFVGLEIDDAVWDATVFCKNRDRLLTADIAPRFLAAVVEQARESGLLSDEHFSVDGTLIEAWASMKSFQPKDGSGPSSSGTGRNPEVDFRGQERKNDTHASRTDPEARLFRKGKGKESKLCFLGHVLMENRNGLVVDAVTTHATGTAERDAAKQMLEALPGTHRKTVGGDKNYDTRDFVDDLRGLRVTPHVAQNTTGRRSAIDGRTTRHPGYAASQRVRKRIEEIFGWGKTVGGMRKTLHRGLERVGWMFVLRTAAYNLVRMRNLLAPATG
jgi:transposase